MKTWIAAAGFAACVALAPSQGQALACANCYNEATAIFQEAKRMIEFAKLLSEAKRSAEHEVRSWIALTDVGNFSRWTYALGDLSRRYFPEGQEVASMMRDGRALARGGLSLDQLLSRSNVSRLERTWGSAERWYDNIESRQRIVAIGRNSAMSALERSQESLAALSAAEGQFNASKGVAEISAGLGAIQLQQLNATHNRTNLEAIRLAIETEQYQAQVSAEEQVRADALKHAGSYASAFDRARAAFGR